MNLQSTCALLCTTAIVGLGPRTAASEPRRVEMEVSTPRLVCASASDRCTLTARAYNPSITGKLTTATMLCDVRAGGSRYSSSGVATVRPDGIEGRVEVALDREATIDSISCSTYLR